MPSRQMKHLCIAALVGTLMMTGLPATRARAHTPEMLQSVRGEIVRAAQALLATMPVHPGEVEQLYGISQRSLAVQPFSSPDRQDWSYWPRRRTGVSLLQLSGAQRARVHDLLSTILSARGHLQVVQTMQLEEVLRALETDGFQRSSENYTVTFFGEPALDRPWSLRFEGHHVSVNLTFGPSSRFSATPLFLGASPGQAAGGHLAGFRPLGAHEDLALRLVRSLSPAQAALAVGPRAPAELLSSQFQREPAQWEGWKTEIEAEGIGWRALDEGQRAILVRLIDDVVGNYRPEIAAGYVEGLDQATIRFLWLGPAKLGVPHYFRITAGDFVYEFDNAQGNANHIHTVWRDRSNDLGEDALAVHYRQSH